MLYCITPHDYCIVLYCIVLYCIAAYDVVLYCVVVHCNVLFCIVVHYTILYYMPWSYHGLKSYHHFCFFSFFSRGEGDKTRGAASANSAVSVLWPVLWSKWCCVFFWGINNDYPLVMTNIAMGNGPFIDGLPIKNGDFPWLCYINNQRVIVIILSCWRFWKKYH